MPISYVAKHLIRSWQLYIALLLGVVLASTFFAGVNIGADTVAKQALDQAVARVPVDYYMGGYMGGYTALSTQNVTKLINQISAIEDVTGVEAIQTAYINVGPYGPDHNYQMYTLVGISQNSHVYNGWINHPDSIDENQTYIPTSASIAKTLKQGDTVQVNITLTIIEGEPQNATPIIYPLNLTVAGFAELDSTALALIRGNYYSSDTGIMGTPGQIISYPSPAYVEDIIIVDWNKTLTKFLDIFYEHNQPYFRTDILVFADRDKIISVWDIPGSLNRLEALRKRIQNEASLGRFSFSVEGTLGSVLSYAQYTTNMMRLNFIAVSLPVFFVAWYMGTTVSDVSFNLRRREIGLLSTKGFSKGQLFRMFIIEAVIIGLVSGTIGLGLSIALNPFFVRAVGGELAGKPVAGIDVAVMTLIFSVTLIVLAIFRPARKASSLPTIDALREYMFVEEAKPHKKRWPWIAFILGTYKLIILALGINLINEVPKLAMLGINILLVILLGVWASFDLMLTPIGSALFFWGFTKLFISGSLKFQEATAKAARFLGDLGVLATKSVQRNPARAASVAFLIALIIGYGVQITGTLASDQDYYTRLVYTSVGADVRIDLPQPINITAIQDLMKQIRGNVPDVVSTTMEYSFYGSSSFGGLQLAAINTTEWPNTAYYEEGWFTGNNMETAFQHLSSDNHTVIVNRDAAERSNLRIGEQISVSLGWYRFGSELSTTDLTIVGFYGIRIPDYPLYGQTITTPSWSYVSVGLFHESFSAIANSSSARMLVKLSSEADKAAATDQIRGLVPPGGILYSVVELIQQQESNLMITGNMNIQRLGVAFGILAASVGAALVSFISLKERQREASMMSVRGLSFKQLVLVLLTEDFAVVLFAVLLGASAGLIIAYGNVASFNAASGSLVSKRMVFSTDAVATMLVYIGLVFASAIIPVVIMSRRYVSKLERVVRQA